MLFGAFAAWALVSFVATFEPLLNTSNVYIGTAAVGAAFALIVYTGASMLPKRRFVTRREKFGCGCASAGAGCTFALFISASMAVAVAGSFAITTTSQGIAFFSAFCGLGLLGGLLLLRFRDAALRDRELELARDLQQRLLPPPSLETNCCRVEARNVPAAYVAGDFYDFLPLADDRLLVVVADVAGKGVAAGLISASAKAIVPLIAAQESRVDRLLSAINDRLAPQLARREFVAMVVALFDGATGELSIANAGMRGIRSASAATSSMKHSCTVSIRASASSSSPTDSRSRWEATKRSPESPPKAEEISTRSSAQSERSLRATTGRLSFSSGHDSGAISSTAATRFFSVVT